MLKINAFSGYVLILSRNTVQVRLDRERFVREVTAISNSRGASADQPFRVSDMSKPCAKCLKEVEFSHSHSIPRSFFRHIHRLQAGGQFVQCTTGPEKTHLAQNTGASPMLCADCEGWMNKIFDKPICRALTTIPTPRSFGDLQKSIFLKVETDLLSRFILSVFWRASLSDNPMYERFKLPEEESNKLADLIFSQDGKITKQFSFSLHRLHTDIRGLDPWTAECIVMPPGIIHVFDGRSESWKFAGHGWLFQAYQPRLTTSQASKIRCYKSGNKRFRVPKLDMFEDPDINKIVGAMIDKNESGHTRVRRSPPSTK